MASHLETTHVPLLYSPQSTIRYGTWMCYNRWSIRTITPIIGVLGWPRIKSHPKPCPRSGTDSTASTWGKRPHPPNYEWAIAYASTTNIVPSKKAIYQDGRKKCLWSRTSFVILWWPIDSVNGTARLSSNHYDANEAGGNRKWSDVVGSRREGSSGHKERTFELLLYDSKRWTYICVWRVRLTHVGEKRVPCAGRRRKPKRMRSTKNRKRM